MNPVKAPSKRWGRIRRAEKFFLGSTAIGAPLSDVEAEAITQCRISKDAFQDFKVLLECKGRWQGGPIFGVRAHGQLRIQMARPGTPRSLMPTGDAPYTMTPAYMLGMSDMLSPAQLDWCGHWLAAPDSMMPSDVEQWAEQGLKLGIVDDENPLLVVGRDRDGLSYWGLVWDVEERQWRDLTIYRW